MEKLELKEIVGYLPYGLKGINKNGTIFLLALNNSSGGSLEKRELSTFLNEKFKPILRPLSDLTKDRLEEEGVFISDYTKAVLNNKVLLPDCLPYYVIRKLYEWHFDIRNLINRGLAIDINTL